MNILVFLTIGETLKSIGNTILYILIFVIVLGLIVGIHEFGHMIFARKAGILCREYAIGMGPKLFSKRKGEIIYSLRAIPIGGFCSIAGETLEEDPFKNLEKIKLRIENGVITGFYLDVEKDSIDYPVFDIVSYDIFDQDNTNNLYMEVKNGDEVIKYPVDNKAIIYYKKDEFQIAPYNRTLLSKNKRQRAMVMFGGPLMNFILAFVVFFVVGLFTGFVNYKSNVIGEVDVNSPINEYIQKNDAITKLYTVTIGEKNITSWTEFIDYMNEYDRLSLAEEITIHYNRNGVTNEVTTVPFIAINSVGIGSDYNYVKEGKTIIKAFASLGDENLGDNSQLKLKDEIIEIWEYNKEHTLNPTWNDLRVLFDNFSGGSKVEEENFVYMKIIRDGNTLEVKVKPYSKVLMDNQTSLNGSKVEATTSSIGLNAKKSFSLVKSISYMFKRTGQSFVAVIDTLKLLFSGNVSIKNLSGPIGIYSITKNAAKYGILYVLNLIGLLSVNIGLMNLFPIPALDGGRLLFLGFEAITKKKPSQKVETILITVTMILLLLLMVVVAYEDILRLF